MYGVFNQKIYVELSVIVVQSSQVDISDDKSGH